MSVMELDGGNARLALAVLLISLSIKLLEAFLLRLKVPDTAARQAELAQQVAQLKRRAAALSSPETFAQSAKAERKAIALEKELTVLQEQHAAAQVQRVLRLPQLLRLALLAGLVGRCLVGAGGGVAAWVGEPRLVWPLGRWLGALTGEPRGAGAVGLVPWAMLCHRVASALVGGRR